MKIGFKSTILSVLLIIAVFVPMGFLKVDSVFAQNGNSLGQEGDGNDASQSESSSQSTNQNSLCVSEESTSLSCNNLSSEISGTSIPGERGPAGPLSVGGKIYTVGGNPVTVVSPSPTPSDAKCNTGDSLISGFHSVYNLDTPGSITQIREQIVGGESFRVDATGNPGDNMFYQAFAFCFNNP